MSYINDVYQAVHKRWVAEGSHHKPIHHTAEENRDIVLGLFGDMEVASAVQEQGAEAEVSGNGGAGRDFGGDRGKVGEAHPEETAS